MSFLGTLEQIGLPLVLQRIEEHAKTGVLVIRQEARRIELYFRDGRLMCIGPVRPDTTLGDRLLRANVISPQVLQETLATLGDPSVSETRLALVLMDLGHVSRDTLREWATKEATSVLQALLNWKQGEVYLEEGRQPPDDRLLISLSLSSLLPAKPQPAPEAPVSQPLTSAAPPQPPEVKQPETEAIHAPASLNVAELVTETPRIALTGDISPFPHSTTDATGGEFATSILPPRVVTTPLKPQPVDTSFLRPDMVLFPVDMASLRERNPQVAITPEQWRVITRVDGRTTLAEICQECYMPVEMVRSVVGELLAMGLVRVSAFVGAFPLQEISPASRHLTTAGLAAGMIAQPYQPAPPQPPVAMSSPSPAFTAPLAFETESQWGNGGNGATFVPGQGWIARPQPLQPLQPSGSLYSSQQIYAAVGAGR